MIYQCLVKLIRKALIKLNISKLSRDLNCDPKTIRKRLNGDFPKTTGTRRKYLDQYRDYIIEVLIDKY